MPSMFCVMSTVNHSYSCILHIHIRCVFTEWRRDTVLNLIIPSFLLVFSSKKDVTGFYQVKPLSVGIGQHVEGAEGR